MNALQWKIFEQFTQDFKTQVQEWTDEVPNLRELQKKAAVLAGTPEYEFELPVVYNTALDLITQADDIKLIVIGDNPGKDEQLKKNSKYLVGQAGKIAEGYFRKNPELGVDFRKNVIILNKTPIHSAKTAQLKTIGKLGGDAVAQLIERSQVWMAERTARLHIDLCNACTESEQKPEIWLVGYSELKPKCLFEKYRDVLRSVYNNDNWNYVFVYQHFSMNRFTIDLNNYIEDNKKETQPLIKNIHELGLIHKNEIFN